MTRIKKLMIFVWVVAVRHFIKHSCGILTDLAITTKFYSQPIHLQTVFR